MAYSRGRPSSGPSIISMLSDRYKQPNNAQSNPAGAGRSLQIFGAPGAGKGGVTQRTEERTYSFSQEEQITQDGRTVYKTKEEKSFSERPQSWSGDNAASAPKVSIKTITLSTKGGGDAKPVQITNNFGGSVPSGDVTITTSGFTGQPQTKDYHYQKTVSTKTVERGMAPQQQQQQQQIFIQQQQNQQRQPSYGQQPQQQQPRYIQPQIIQQPQQQQQQQQQSYNQKQSTFVQQQSSTFSQPQQQQQPRYGQQAQPQQQQPLYGQQKQQPSYGQPQQQQQPTYGQQKQQPSYGQPQQQQQQQPVYGQQKQQPSYGQPQQQQQPTYGQQKQQPSYGQPQQQQQQPTYGQQKQQPSYGQPQQQQQQPTYGQQQPPQPTPKPQYQQPQQQQRPTYGQQQQPQQQQQTQHSSHVQQSVSTVRSSTYSQGQPSGTFTITTHTTTSNDVPPWEEFPEEGVHENEPEQRPDLVRESDKNVQAELPSTGMAQDLRYKFMTGQVENRPSVRRRELTPPSMVGGGVFENEPAYNPDVVHHQEAVRDALPERGTAQNMATRFKQFGQETRVSGPPPAKREITPDRTTRMEYVSEPRGYVEKYEGRAESGVFESQPEYRADVVKADTYEDDRLPEMGLARNIAAHFREVGKYRPAPAATFLKEFTPPREEGTGLQGYGVYESNPQYDPSVVHHEDRQRDVLPERGMARNIVTRFRSFSSGENTPRSRGKKEFTPPRDGGGVYENNPTEFIPDYNRMPESGVLENQPQVRHDVVREDHPPPMGQMELPERGMARGLVSTWRQKEYSSATVTPTGSGRPKEFTPPREEPRVLAYRAGGPHTPTRGGSYGGFGWSDGSVHPSELPGQYQPMAEASVFESEPVYLEHVVREADTDWMEGMPRSETTRRMVAKFKHIQQQAGDSPSAAAGSARPPMPGRQDGEDRNSRETTPDKVGRSKSMRVAVQLEKCGACQKTVYAMEKIEIEKHAYHKSCFRCSHCHCILTPKTFAINKNVMFCTNHYKQLFATKGNYDEGFGHDQHKNRWKSDHSSSNDNPSSCSDSDAGTTQP